MVANALQFSQNITDPLTQGIKSLGNAAIDYFALRPIAMNDKYKHSVVSMSGAQGGLVPAAITGVAGLAKEMDDIYNKSINLAQGRGNYNSMGEILQDSWGDIKADATGILQGLTKPMNNPYTTMQTYYNPYIKR